MANNIIGTGLSGLVGSRVVELLSSYTFEDISRKTGTDISDENGVLERIKNSSADYVLHMAAYTNVDSAQEQKDLGEQSESWKINVNGTEHVVKAAKATNKKIIYISTDFVFDGEHTPVGGYTEEDTPRPINWYATTKYEGEKRVQESGLDFLIVRIAYPYRAQYEKNDFFRAMKNRLEQGLAIKAITDHKYCPTFIDDIAPALDVLIKENKTGIYHVTGNSALSPHEAAEEIAKTFDLDRTLIGSTTRDEYFHDKAKRPFDLSMNNDKIKQLGVTLHSFQEGVEIIKGQLV